MKKIISVLLVLLVLGGCTQQEQVGELNVFIPGEYINEEVVKSFEKEVGAKVNINTFASNEEMYTKLLGGTVYDVIVPSDYMIERLIEEKMLMELDKDQIPNLGNLYSGVANMSYDPNNAYTVPYFWGNVGIVYDSTVVDQKDVESEGWAVLQNQKYKGLIYMYDSERDAFMMALKALGFSMNTTKQEELDAAFEWLIQIDNTMDPAYVTDEAIDGLAYAGDGKYMGMMYSGDAAYILSENENMKYWAPQEGTNYWVDAMCIHKDSKQAELAMKFMNFFLDYDNAYENSSFVGYASVNADVLNDMTLENGDFYLNDAYLPRVRTNLDEEFHNNEDTRKIISDLWIRVKNN